VSVRVGRGAWGVVDVVVGERDLSEWGVSQVFEAPAGWSCCGHNGRVDAKEWVCRPRSTQMDKLQAAGGRLRAAGCGLRVANASCKRRTLKEHSLSFTNTNTNQPAHRLLLTVHCSLFIAHRSPLTKAKAKRKTKKDWILHSAAI
jgi:hypothetical protein